MDFRSFLNKANQIEIRIRKAINSQMHGNYASIFKGAGVEFNDLRQYQYGDDVRHIDWNSSAKGHGTFVKIFKEEKEQTVFFMLDCSASQQIGSSTQSKLDYLKELTSVLSLSAIQDAGHIGFCCFTDKIEKFMAPAPGKKHGYKTISEIYKFKAESSKTDIKESLRFALQVLKRKSLVILISDFIDNNFEDLLVSLGNKHDLILIQLQDLQELELPKMGIVPIYNPETGKTSFLNSSSKSFQKLVNKVFVKSPNELQQLCKQHKIDYVKLTTGADYIPEFVKLFTLRKR
ncbi:DUF58 domain-containing protein [Sandaracinomonas limnophila]|uniref:DUF58 domain-containing protein n=1 Tax=Sandaracinomonas limnophila TaxID=1862386 RepID=A0A437PQ28_9BACT|nr:DUF58 domain-containing protein [Sandaracinomonas limnophila]RVU24204.1 DUF58 domain-containing protein [Sandaracinomonas limnophila]